MSIEKRKKELNKRDRLLFSQKVACPFFLPLIYSGNNCYYRKNRIKWSKIFFEKLFMKKIKNRWITVPLCALSIMLFPALAKADFLIKSVRNTEEITLLGMAQPAKTEQGQTWIAKNKFRLDMGEHSKIIRPDLNKIYIIDHFQNTYSDIDIPVDLGKLFPPEAQQMLQMTQVTASVSDSGEAKKIKTWKCNKFLVEVIISIMGINGALNIEMWTSKDLKIDLDTYSRFYMEALLLNPLFKGVSKEFQKLEGYPVLTRFSMMMMGGEMKYLEEVTSIEKKSAPEGTYDLPQGYVKTTYNPLPWLK